MNQIPKLRFRNNDGTDFPVWEEKVLGSCVAEFREKSKTSNQHAVLTSSRKGLIPQNEYYGENNRITDRDNKGFNIIPNDYLTYRSRSDDGKFHFNLNSTGESGVISTYYPVFKNKMGSNLYLLHLLNTNWRKLYKYSVGTSQKVLSFNELKSIKFLFPIEVEQQKIANFLESVDEWIQNLEKQKAAIEAYKKGMIQKIFSQQIRFKDEGGKDFPEWKENAVGDIFKVTRGSVLATSKTKNEKSEKYCYPVFSSQTQNNGLMGFYNEYLYEDAITWTTDGANAGSVNFRKGKFYCTNVCGVLISNVGYANNMAAELLNRVTKKYVSYVGNPKLMNNVMATIKIKLPSIAEQQKIANFLSSIDSLIQAKNSQITNAKLWNKGLLQQMFV